MGSVLGGGSKGKSSAGAITSAANNSADAITQSSQDAAYFNLKGSQTAADYQNAAKEYLERQDALPTSLRTSALNSLGGLYGGSGSITDRAMASPLYQAAVQQGENSVLRNASATGGLRSGNASENLAQVNQNALVAAYNDQIAGLQGLSSLPSNANNIAAYMAGTGNTLGQGQVSYGQAISQGQVDAANARAQGQIAAANNKSQASQNSANNTTALVGAGLTAAMMFSDRRLKADIQFIGNENGLRKYSWSWNKLANALGLYGRGHGVMADEVQQTHPGAVSVRDEYLIVDYSKLGVSYAV